MLRWGYRGSETVAEDRDIDTPADEVVQEKPEGIRSYDVKRFGPVVRRWREAQKLTGTQLGEKLGVSKGYISQLEGGRPVEMTLRFHQAYARALKIPFAVYAEAVGMDLEGIPPVEQTLTEAQQNYLRDIEDLSDEDIEKLRELTRHYRRLGMLGPAESIPPAPDIAPSEDQEEPGD